MPEKVITKLKEIENNPPKIKGFKMCRAEYLISSIVTHKQEKHPGSYSILNMKFMTNVVPSANKYLDLFRRAGIIEWKNYSAGRNSRLYRITKQYDGHTLSKPITDNELIRRIEKNIAHVGMTNSKKYPQLHEWVKSVTIDVDAAYETIEETYKVGLKENPNKAEARRTYSYAEVDRIETGCFYFKVNGTNGRLDTNITGLVSEVVPHLRFNQNKRLIEIDVVNSQPFFAVGLFNPCPALERIMMTVLGERLTKTIKEMNPSQYEDVKLYTSLVTTGMFYDYMMEQFTLNKIQFVDRKNIKEQLFAVFFAKNNSLFYSKAVQLFKSLFPTVYRLFEAVKEGEHNKLSILLQRIESYSMLECAVQKIIYELPGLPLATKHDSILPVATFSDDNVSASQEDIRAADIVLEVINEVIGAKPVLKIKTPTSSYIYPLNNQSANTSIA